MILEKYMQQAIDSFNGVSFSPERRGKQTIKDYSEELTEDIKELETKGTTGNYEEKYINHFLTWLNAQSRCMSSMITGPSNFPVNSNRKKMDYEENAYKKFRTWREGYFTAVNRVKTLSPEEDLDKALKDYEKTFALNEQCKEINKIISQVNRKKDPTSEDLDAMNKELKEKFESNYTFKFETYYSGSLYVPTILLYSLKLKTLKEKIHAMRVRIERKKNWQPIKFEGGYIDIEDDRVKIFHDEKPESEVIQALKGRGFRWSPNWKCWTRKHTGQAVYDAKLICLN